MNKWLTNWVKNRYPDSKRDLCTCFIERGFGLLTEFGYSAMVTMESWMFLSSFEKLRKDILGHHRIAAMVYMNHMVMRIAFNTCATIFANHFSSEPGLYTRVEYQDLNEEGIPLEFPVKRHAPKKNARVSEALANPDCGWFYRADADKFKAIPGSPIAYWASDAMVRAFEVNAPMGNIAEPRQGMVTRDNARFMRAWWEVSNSRIAFNLKSHEEAQTNGAYKWVPCTSGGSYRKWYGNNESVINWANDGEEIIAFSGAHIKNREYYFRESVTWTAISSSKLSTRYAPQGFVPEHAGNCFYANQENLKLLQGVCNSSFCQVVTSMLSPTLNFNVGDLVKIPIRQDNGYRVRVSILVDSCRFASREDWDAFETSWDFRKHPLLQQEQRSENLSKSGDSL